MYTHTHTHIRTHIHTCLRLYATNNAGEDRARSSQSFSVNEVIWFEYAVAVCVCKRESVCACVIG